METPQAISWSHWPLKSRPRQAILLILILFALASLVLYWLGLSWQSGLLLIALVFSLRDFLFARSLMVNREGLSLSTPLTGAKVLPWKDLPPLERRHHVLRVAPRNGRSFEFTLPQGETLDLLEDWIAWQAAGAVDIPTHDPPPLTRA